MFRAAFPTSPEELEKVESAWVKQSFDCSTANGGSGKSSLRLAGTWVHPETASELAPLYYLEPIVTSLLSACPDPNQEYRRSTKAGSNNNNNSNAPPTSASTENGASSPVKASGRAPLSPRASPKPTKRRREEREATPDSQSSTGLGLPTRRVVRGSSPALPVVPGSGSGSPNTQRISRTKMTKTVVNRSSPVKGESSPKKAGVTATATAATTTTRSVIVEKVREEEDEEVVDVPGPNMHEDIAEQKELIAKLKAERDANAAAALAAAAATASKTEAEDSKEGKEEEEEETQVPEPEPQSSKRAREDEQEGGQQEVLQFKFREPEEQEVIAAREIRSNKRLSLDLEPQQKSAAWGALWFVSGLAAA